MEIRVKANGAIVVEQTADEVRAELVAEFGKILNLEAADHIGEEGQAIANSVSRFCRLLSTYHLDVEDTLLLLRSIVDLCERWRKRREPSA